MGVISVTSQGDLKRTLKFLSYIQKLRFEAALKDAGAQGVAALNRATPRDTGLTAASWSYEVVRDGSGATVYWTNASMGGSTPIVIFLQFGHGTGTGGYVQGIDFINPALRPVFDRITENVWKAVTTA